MVDVVMTVQDTQTGELIEMPTTGASKDAGLNVARISFANTPVATSHPNVYASYPVYHRVLRNAYSIEAEAAWSINKGKVYRSDVRYEYSRHLELVGDCQNCQIEFKDVEVREAGTYELRIDGQTPGGVYLDFTVDGKKVGTASTYATGNPFYKTRTRPFKIQTFLSKKMHNIVVTARGAAGNFNFDSLTISKLDSSTAPTTSIEYYYSAPLVSQVSTSTVTMGQAWWWSDWANQYLKISHEVSSVNSSSPLDVANVSMITLSNGSLIWGYSHTNDWIAWNSVFVKGKDFTKWLWILLLG